MLPRHLRPHRAILPLVVAAALDVSGCATRDAAGGTAGGLGSIGAILGRDAPTGAVWAQEVPEGLAADRAGLRTGDRIKMIDGVHVDDLERDRVVRMLRGPVGSRVTLTVVRDDEVVNVTVVREPRHPRVEPLPSAEKIE
jgi:C-terminal processing protease CtpA/Prc